MQGRKSRRDDSRVHSEAWSPDSQSAALRLKAEDAFPGLTMTRLSSGAGEGGRLGGGRRQLGSTAQFSSLLPLGLHLEMECEDSDPSGDPGQADRLTVPVSPAGVAVMGPLLGADETRAPPSEHPGFAPLKLCTQNTASEPVPSENASDGRELRARAGKGNTVKAKPPEGEGIEATICRKMGLCMNVNQTGLSAEHDPEGCGRNSKTKNTAQFYAD